ncbi:MAG: electron transport complex subunit E [Lachnospiraceae bacterium]|nr:electron transport complex subunit E [Lachnospiraceae bacterium]
MNSSMERIYNGIVKENPVFIMMLGMCPCLAVTTSVTNAIGMGVSTTAVLVASNVVISLVRKIIPDEVRLPAEIVIVASLVTVVQLIMQAYFVALNDSLGVYIPLIVVNCIILGRAEAYAMKNDVVPSLFDGIGMGLGFTIGITILAFFRELLGAGTVAGFRVMPSFYKPIDMLVKAPGAFLVLGVIIMVMNAWGISSRQAELVSGDGCVGCAAADNCAAKGKENCEKKEEAKA